MLGVRGVGGAAACGGSGSGVGGSGGVDTSAGSVWNGVKCVRGTGCVCVSFGAFGSVAIAIRAVINLNRNTIVSDVLTRHVAGSHPVHPNTTITTTTIVLVNYTTAHLHLHLHRRVRGVGQVFQHFRPHLRSVEHLRGGALVLYLQHRLFYLARWIG
eukprot:GDKK01070063.1.p2 GENE.GDKK01070063.1~~GDKK01070063.1.p2  ORF type:complete len:157 (-),score=7.21 GDKK01070063.1:165-635(-)